MTETEASAGKTAGKRTGIVWRIISFVQVLFAVSNLLFATAIILNIDSFFDRMDFNGFRNDVEVVELTDLTRVDPAFDGKIVEARGFADAKDTVEDIMFGIKTTALSLRRKVEYYQWIQKMDLAISTDITYYKAWVSKPIDSFNFVNIDYKGKNVVLKEIPTQSFYAPGADFGAYKLPTYIIDSIRESTSAAVGIPSQIIAELGDEVVHVRDNVVYLGRSPDYPEIGDVRVTFTEVDPIEISILARISGNTFEPFKVFSGRTFSRVAIAMKAHIILIMDGNISYVIKVAVYIVMVLVFFISLFFVLLFFMPSSSSIPYFGAFLGTVAEARRILFVLLLILVIAVNSWISNSILGILLIVSIGLAFIAYKFLYKRCQKQIEKEEKMLEQH